MRTEAFNFQFEVTTNGSKLLYTTAQKHGWNIDPQEVIQSHFILTLEDLNHH